MSRWTHIKSVLCNGVVAIRDGRIIECDDPKDEVVAYSLTWNDDTSVHLGKFSHFVLPIVRSYN